MNVDEIARLLPPALLQRSGTVFYSGKQAFSGRKPLYLLGLNPGGNPEDLRLNTVARHLEEFANRHEPWSAYLDESWAGAAAGTYGMQPRVVHLIQRLGLDPRNVPSSNVVFVRTRSESRLQGEQDELLEVCWPVHDRVLGQLGIRVIACFGQTAGSWLRRQLHADELVDVFCEKNRRGWKSELHRAPSGLMIATLSHPSRADWRNPSADPAPLLMRALQID